MTPNCLRTIIVLACLSLAGCGGCNGDKPPPPAAAPPAAPERDPRVEDAVHALTPLLRALGDRRDFAIRFWDGRGLRTPPGVEPRFTLVIRRPGALRRMLLPPTDLAIGEAFVHGDFDVEGDIFAFVSLPDRLGQLPMRVVDWVRLAARLLPLTDAPPAPAGRSAADLRGERHSVARDADAVRFHYDVGNEFYGLWLGEQMVYSCAYFPTDDASLDDAQLAKLDLVLDKLQLRDGMRLLDIGCGWGGLLLRAAERFPRLTAVGITLARRQHALAEERIAAAGLADRVRVELLDYRDAPARLGRFDRIASIGMAEHVGARRMDDYFAAARDSLEPGGLFLNHAITAQPARAAAIGGGLLPGPLGRALGSRSFIDAYVFPDGDLLTLPQILAPAQAAGFEVRDVESLRPHYARTLRHWVAGLESHWDQAVAAAGEAVARTWRLYMAGAATGFEAGRLDVHQQLLALPRADGSSDAPALRNWS
jgi:cyclopropane-fatty-acyl-phospholipid synthase